MIGRIDSDTLKRMVADGRLPMVMSPKQAEPMNMNK